MVRKSYQISIFLLRKANNKITPKVDTGYLIYLNYLFYFPKKENGTYSE